VPSIFSAKTCYDFGKSFLILARELTGHNDLMFVESKVIEPVIQFNLPPIKCEIGAKSKVTIHVGGNGVVTTDPIVTVTYK